MEIVKRPQPPKGLSRLLYRLPIHLYRAGFGWLFGQRLMMLTHVGRVSGKPRNIVIEVVEHAADGSYLAASGFGTKADWYRNVRKRPDVTIHIGRRMIPVTAEQLSTEEGGDLMARYAARHPRAARKLCRLMGFAVDGSAEDYRTVGREVPFLRFVPRT
ncbi:nitroreductase family deazaflavin-dependent oxidoreductase [Amycolatopsis cihanbeyliensis]|uniref:Deazaflavin-dependent oxidoreductase (Nitroreductase family) n=1 Tax=Amycolatopsis cihanbeyliensis TaxID=1128664 RepID=A0A542DRT4_AMYCI|nr:nitroreductase family deazaflavin-dependent oxidoreductase [Amycolatopsis cihanbeyliensis]TQJ05808.1 deazaflavin-dependent oxidoreductase (nitroreductase family) [Amycolatopsis cihanbeyliensis]